MSKEVLAALQRQTEVEDAFLDALKSGRPRKTGTVIVELQYSLSAPGPELRTVMWYMITMGKLEFTHDRRIRLPLRTAT